VRRFNFALLQNHQARSDRPPDETELHVHFRPNLDRVADENFLHATAPITDVVSFYRALRIGHMPSWVVAMVFVSTFISVISITIYVSKRSSGEISEFGTHRSLWRI